MRNTSLERSIQFTRWVAVTFILVLGISMACQSLYQEHTLAAGKECIDRLKASDVSDPALGQTVRDLDYLYRLTVFQTRDREAYGFFLLGVAFLLLSIIHIIQYFLLPPALTVPTIPPAPDDTQRTQQLVFTACGIFILFVLIGGLRLRTPFSLQVHQFSPDGSTASISTGTTLTAGDSQVADSAQTSTAPSSDRKLSGGGQTPQKEEPIILSQALKEGSENWPQFRGSILPNKNSLPKNWKFTEKWKAKIPRVGFNSPVVWDDQIFVAGGDKEKRAIYSYDAQDGKLLWEAASSAAPSLPDVTEDTGLSAPTLAVDKNRVYGIFATGELLCCDHKGKVLWRRQLPTPDILYGYASSPLLLGDKLIIQYDMEEHQDLYALDVKTGKDLWRTSRETSASWSSPSALIKDGKPIIFTAGNMSAEAFDGETGKVLWKQDKLSGEVATSAVALNDSFYFANDGAFTGAFNAENGNIVFESRYIPAPDVASPIVAADTFILFTSGGSAIAVDTKKGEELYEEVFDNGFYASPVLIEGKIVAVNMDGDLFLMTPTKKGLTRDATYSLNTEVLSTPAFYKQQIIIRTKDNNLICLENRSASGSDNESQSTDTSQSGDKSENSDGSQKGDKAHD